MEMVLLLFLRYWRLGIILPPVPPTLKHPSAPFQNLLNILRRDQPDPGECEDLFLKKDIMDGFLHQSVDQSKSLTSFLQTLWSRLPGDPALLAFLEPGVDI